MVWCGVRKFCFLGEEWECRDGFDGGGSGEEGTGSTQDRHLRRHWVSE